MKKMQNTVISLSTGSKGGSLLFEIARIIWTSETFEQSLGKVRE